MNLYLLGENNPLVPDELRSRDPGVCGRRTGAATSVLSPARPVALKQHWLLPHGDLHSPTIRHGAVAQPLEKYSLPPACHPLHYVENILLTEPIHQDVREVLSSVMGTL